ncbi:MAG: helicase HerA-like domain-containing protein, partial [Nitrososphaera sp.]
MNTAKFHVGQTLDGIKFEVDRASLTKHAIILGATGSGKTVLSKVLVEEAALQGIPTFAIDPKGDIGNLAFRSTDFDFSEWSGKEADTLKIERAKHAANLQKHYFGKASEFRVAPGSAEQLEKITVRIFTPKSSSGLAVGISPDLSAPEDFNRLLSEDLASAADLLDLTTFNLLRLAGYDEDDRKEITFVSAILENAWKAGQSLTVSELIRNIESPSFRSIGSLPVSKVVSDRERKDLATKINLLISDPKL